jgi:uncharacterized membrane protein (UPF0127 family)
MLTVHNQTRGTMVGERVRRSRHVLHRLLGLLPRASLSPGEGLWLIPCRLIHTVGMRFRIDVIYLDRELRVVGLQAGLRPFRLGQALAGTHSVLELGAGTIAASGTRPGDQLRVDG